MVSLVTKIILELDAQIQSTSQMKQLVGSLKTHIANCFTTWFKSQDLASDSKLIEAFLFPLVRANPHGIFSIVLETGNPFPVEILGEILAYATNPEQFLNQYYLFSSYEENAIFSTQLTVVLPLDSRDGITPPLLDEEWLEELEETVPVIWNWKISKERGIKRMLKSLQDKNGLLIDFHQDLDMETVQRILRQIKQISPHDPDWVRFRDAYIQQIWSQEIYEMSPSCEIEEKVIAYNTRLEASSACLKRLVF